MNYIEYLNLTIIIDSNFLYIDKNNLHKFLKEYRGGNNRGNTGFNGDRGDHSNYEVDSTNEVGKERLSATGIGNLYFMFILSF